MPKCWRKSLGERGCRVIVFERKSGGTLYREVYIGGKRVASKKSLGHSDREQAQADGYTLLAALKAREDALSGGKLTLQTLFDNYLVSPAHRAKKPRTQREDERKLERLIDFLGFDRDVLSLSDSDVERYNQARLRGECGRNGQEVRARTIQADLVALRTMLNWGLRRHNGRGRPLLEYNPLRGVKLPSEKNPRRPVETYDRYLKLMAVAGDVNWRLPAALALAESTGQRISSILHLRRGDIDFSRPPHGWVHFRAEHQKTGREHWVPLSVECADVLKEHRGHVSSDPDSWVFPRQRKPAEPVSVDVMSQNLRRALGRADLPSREGGLWHPWRRKWGSERKGFPLKDVAVAGGWKDPNTLLTCYQQADEVTIRKVALEAGKLYENGVREGTEVTPLLTPKPHSDNGASWPIASQLSG